MPGLDEVASFQIPPARQGEGTSDHRTWHVRALAFGLGEAFQFDWPEDWAIIGNERTKLPEAIRFHQADVTDTAAILPALDGENGLHGNGAPVLGMAACSRR